MELGKLIDAEVKKQYPDGKVPAAMKPLSDKDRYVDALLKQIRESGLPEPVREFRFHSERLWRIDIAYPAKKIMIEVDGGGWGRVVTCHKCHISVMKHLKDGRMVPVREGGRHNTAAGMEADNEKLDSAVALGWRPLKFNPRHIKEGFALKMIKSVWSFSA